MNPLTIQKQIPIKGQRILLRGFDCRQEAEAKGLLAKHGYHLATSIALADIVLVGGGNAATAVEAAKKAGITVTAWAEFNSHLPPPAGPAMILDAGSRPAVEIHGDFVRILDQVLPRAKVSSPLVPGAFQFRHLCHDAALLGNARAVALGVRHGFPVALEGDTSASKTTAVLWVAHLLGQPVVRLNLHGQADASELVGRYVPGGAHDGGHRRRRAPGITSNAHDRGCSETETMTAWNKCDLEPVEETATPPAWVFKEGAIPQAMRRGDWVVLDELNLAEPQTLERLNSVLEQPSSLVLSEGDGTVFGPGGHVPVAAEFRLFATMNPAEYAGRSVLSPAFRDRWLVWHHAETPGESTFAAMLRCLVFGEQPEVNFRGLRYQSAPTPPVYPELAGVPGIRDLLPRLAMFHASLCQASGMGGSAPSLGRVRRERYVFTRRSLLTCLQLLQHAVKNGPATSLGGHLQEAIEIAYLGRLHDGADRNAAFTLLRAAGLVET